MIVLVLPAYNEYPALQSLLIRARQLQSTLRQPLRVIVVDDGSEDDTAECARLFQGLDLKLVQHPFNSGLSKALQTGLSTAVESCHEDDVIVTMDADDTHPPALIRQMIDRMDEGADLVIASRYCEGSRISGLSTFRKLLSWGAGWLFRLSFPINGVRDFTCGYRAYRAKLLQQGFALWGEQFIDQPGFSCMVDVLLKLSALDPVIVEVPLILRYDRRCTTSKMQIRRTLTETLALLIRRRWQRRSFGRKAAQYLLDHPTSVGEEQWKKVA